MTTKRRPAHIDSDVWILVNKMNPWELAGQLTMFDPPIALARTGRSLEDLIAAREVGTVMGIPDLPEGFLRLQRIALENGGVPLLHAGDFQRGVTVIGPAGIGAPNSWNLELVQRAACYAARHMAVSGVTLNFAPVADHAIDTHQGRSQEGSAVESPLLMSRMVAAMVRGYQGNSLADPNSVAATLKHVGPYQYTYGPDYTDCGPSKRLFLEDSWPAFQAGLKAGAAAIMMSFVALDGVPAHASEYLSRLVTKHGGKHVIRISDFTGINELMEFGVAGTPSEAALLAFKRGGIHLDLNGGVYGACLPKLVEEGTLTLYELMTRAAEVVQLKKKLGLFEDPFRYGRPAEAVLLDAHHSLSAAFVQLAEESIVLLRLTALISDVLPIPGNARILVTGPLAHDKEGMLGEWCGNARSHLAQVVTIYEGIVNEWGRSNVTCAPGIGFETSDEPMRHQAFAAAKDKTHIVVCLGEPWNWSGESKVRLMPKVPDLQVRFVEQLREATAADIIVLITAGRQLKIPDAVQRCAQAVFWAPQLGTFAGTAVANVLSGRKNPSGRLAYSLPCHEAVTSGFSHRERRIGRPAAFTNRATREYATPGWSAHYQELGPRNSLAEFHFGEGYSYTSFELSDPELSGTTLSLRGNEPLLARVTVTNTGSRPGKETVQLYWHDTVAQAVPRRLELLDFQQVELMPGESREISFGIIPNMLAQYGGTLEEGAKPRPDPYPVYLFIVQNAGQAEEALFALSEKTLRFVLRNRN
jgi:beta-glucosidase